MAKDNDTAVAEEVKEEAKAELEALRELIKADLDASEEVAAIKESIKACREAFNSSFSEILTDQQLEIWNSHLAEKEEEENV